jgi:hypothetical protein
MVREWNVGAADAVFAQSNNLVMRSTYGADLFIAPAGSDAFATSSRSPLTRHGL